MDQQFWPLLMSGQLGNFHHEYLVTSATYTGDWKNWEMHPNGDEIVALLSGEATVIVESAEGVRTTLHLREPGSFVFVPRGSWHTAKLDAPATMFFITPGEGTQHRPA